MITGGEDDQECAQGVRGDGGVEGDHRGADRVERSRAPGDDSEARAQEDLGEGVRLLLMKLLIALDWLARPGRPSSCRLPGPPVVLKGLGRTGRWWTDWGRSSGLRPGRS